MAQRGRQRLLVIVARLSRDERREGDEVQARNAEREHLSWRSGRDFPRLLLRVQSDSESRIVRVIDYSASCPIVDAGLFRA